MTEPHASGLLEIGDGNRIYWESCGNPDGKPMVVLHGGPGRGCDERMRPARSVPGRAPRSARVQRGHAADPFIGWLANTTAHLVADLELLREHLGIDRWLLRGGSWGVTLALPYPLRYPHQVWEIVLSSIFTARPGEIDRLYGGVGDSIQRNTDDSPPGRAGPTRNCASPLLAETCGLWESSHGIYRALGFGHPRCPPM